MIKEEARDENGNAFLYGPVSFDQVETKVQKQKAGKLYER